MLLIEIEDQIVNLIVNSRTVFHIIHTVYVNYYDAQVCFVNVIWE